ncbi:MAG: precorrin-3B synthase [Alphaproteobacteria bacterium]|nr:precorrin-3B synthase [Alphaproteobacteria bacterium]
MQTGDGLLARIRIQDGRLEPGKLERLATIAGTYGNGIVEITARGNLQVRGLSPAATGHFARAVRQIVTVETGLVVETPPLCGDDPLEVVDPRPVAAEIRHLARPLNDMLGPKVTVVVDGAGQIGLADLKADIRLVASSPDDWLLTVGNHALGSTQEPVECAQIILAAIASLGLTGRGSDLSPIALRAQLAERIADAAPTLQQATPPIGPFQLFHDRAIGLALPYGAIAWQSLVAIAQDEARFGIREFRLAPHHGLLAIGAQEGIAAEAAGLGFIAGIDDPRRRISACIGSPGCTSGHIPARSVANRLAGVVPDGQHLHVSGCAKGCAHPRRAAVTLVGQHDGYGLVIEGTAGDTPVTILRADQLESAIGPSGQG